MPARDLAGERVPAEAYAMLAKDDRDLIDLVIEVDRDTLQRPSVPTARPLSLNDDIEQTIESALDEENNFIDPWLLFRDTDVQNALDTAEAVCAQHNLPTIVYDCETFEEGDLTGAVVHDSDGEPEWVDGVFTEALYHAMNAEVAVILHQADMLLPTAKDAVRTFFKTETEYDYLADKVPGINPKNLLKMGDAADVTVIATASGGGVQTTMKQELIAVDL